MRMIILTLPKVVSNLLQIPNRTGQQISLCDAAVVGLAASDSLNLPCFCCDFQQASFVLSASSVSSKSNFANVLFLVVKMIGYTQIQYV
jgi:hypothetical protein